MYGGRTEAEKVYNRALSRRIAKAIHRRDWTYREAGKAIGVCENTVYRWTEGKAPLAPSAMNLAKLCRVCDLDANELLGVKR